MNAKTRTLFAILLTVCMLVSGMPFAASAEDEPATPTDLAPVEQETPAENGTGENGETTNEEIPAGEIPADEQDNPEEAGSQKEDGFWAEPMGKTEFQGQNFCKKLVGWAYVYWNVVKKNDCIQ